MTIKGNLQTVNVALTLICGRLAESREQHIQRSQNPSEESDDITVEFLVGAAQAGAIIGKGGANINLMRQETGARIKISSECLPMSTEKTVNVRGPHAAVAAATERIVTGLNEVSDRPPRQLYIPQPELQAFAGYYGMQQMQPTQGMYGYGQQGMGGNPYQQHQQNPHQQQQQNYGPPSEEQTLVLPVPENVMGGVIGRRGVHINEVRQRSGARIKIPQSDPTSSERMLTITGTPQANEMAIALIHQKMAQAQIRA
jgi:transcription antitermination factor NusA-like protein